MDITYQNIEYTLERVGTTFTLNYNPNVTILSIENIQYDVLSQGYVILQIGGVQQQTYTHTQNSAQTVWNINHALNRYPGITIVDSTGTVVVGTYEYIDANNVRATFSAAFSGKAYLN